MKTKLYRQYFEQAKGQVNQLEKSIKINKETIKHKKRELINTEEAQVILQTVGKQTQEEIVFHISDLVTMALAAVFEEPYIFNLEFISKRGKTEAEISFIKNDEKINPMNASGGGAVDIASFALRIALWNLGRPKTRNTIVLDEPFRFLSQELQPKAGKMLKLLSEKLNIQFLIVTHNQNLIEAGDKIFTVTQRKGISNVV